MAAKRGFPPRNKAKAYRLLRFGRKYTIACNEYIKIFYQVKKYPSWVIIPKKDFLHIFKLYNSTGAPVLSDEGSI